MTECPNCGGEGKAERKCDYCVGWGGSDCPKCGSCGVVLDECDKCEGSGEVEGEEDD